MSYDEVNKPFRPPIEEYELEAVEFQEPRVVFYSASVSNLINNIPNKRTITTDKGNEYFDDRVELAKAIASDYKKIAKDWPGYNLSLKSSGVEEHILNPRENITKTRRPLHQLEKGQIFQEVRRQLSSNKE